VSSEACVLTLRLGSHKQAPRIAMNQLLDFIVHYPTVTATLALAGGLAVAGAWMSVRAYLGKRRRKSAGRR